MKRQPIKPSAPPQELYGLPPPYLRASLDPSCSSPYPHHAPPFYSSPIELTYEEVYPPKEFTKNKCKTIKNERIARFEINTEKLRKRHNPQLYTKRNKPYLFYFDITKCISYATALGGCPTPQVSSSIFCTDEINKDTITSFTNLKELIQLQKCSAYTVKSVTVFGRCVPEAVIGVTNTLNNLQSRNNSLDTLKNMFGDDTNIPQDQQVKNSQILKVLGDLKVTVIVMNPTHENYQRLSIGFKSGVFEDQSIVATSLPSNQVSVLLVAWIAARSCWNVKLTPGDHCRNGTRHQCHKSYDFIDADRAI
uniref:SPARK domain-containing protein n=1 Tax=Heterorhabditis bacteriophora TaxID=37862 RepID=A0A1I7XVD2_HETBA